MSVAKLSDFKEFPACDVLGYSLDFTTTGSTDIKSVIAAVKRGRRIIRYYPDEDTRKLEVGKYLQRISSSFSFLKAGFVEGVTYDVPRCIGVTDYNSSDGNYVTYKNGVEAASSLKVDVSLSARYLAVSASTSTSYSIEKTYRREDQWAMYSFNADTYLASLRDYIDLLNESSLLNRLEDMVPIGDGSNDRVVQDWKDFFDSWGTHVILNSAFGARFQLNVWASNSDSSVNERFSTSVTAAFNGIGAGGQFDTSVTTEEQYKTFSEYMQRQVSVVGGNPQINKELTADPAHNDVFVKWAGTAAEDSSIATLNVTALWVLMKEANKSDVRAAADMVQNAFNYLVSNPIPYKTAVVFDIQSDWAEFNLLAPDGVIIPDDNNRFPDNTVASNTRVQWGKEHSHQYERKTLRFFVVNDGSPIDFSISHGSNGGRPGEGRAEAIIEAVNYLNDEITDNVWNTVWFYRKPVSVKAATSRAKLSRTNTRWDAVLKRYLEDIGAGDWV